MNIQDTLSNASTDDSDNEIASPLNPLPAARNAGNQRRAVRNPGQRPPADDYGWCNAIWDFIKCAILLALVLYLIYVVYGLLMILLQERAWSPILVWFPFSQKWAIEYQILLWVPGFLWFFMMLFTCSYQILTLLSLFYPIFILLR